MEDFERELKFGFLEEATQILTDAEQCFLALEGNPKDRAVTDKLFRLAHNLKGSSKAVGFSAFGGFTHQLESLMLKIKNGELEAHAETINLLLRCSDHLQKWVEKLKTDFEAQVDSAELAQELVRATEGGIASPAVGAEPAAPPVEDALVKNGVPSESAFGFFDDAPVVLTPAPVVKAPAPPAPAPKAKEAAKAPAADDSIRVSLQRLEKLINFVGEMVILQSVLKEQGLQVPSLGLKKTIDQLGKVTKEVQDISMSLRMIPLKQTFQKMQRIVRDTSASLGKKVQLVLEGEETEVDKTVLESIGDPLVHLIRNAVDHGIEGPEGRQAAGKPEQGTVTLRAFHQGSELILEIRDDGRGLDAKKLVAKAVEKGILPAGKVLSDAEAYQLIFAPGFSTKVEVTDVSGRGVGMDVVRTNITALQGSIDVETELGKGSCFRVHLPLTLAIIEGMVIRSAGERYVVPLSHIHETLRPVKADVHFATGVGEVLSLRGESLVVHRLSKMLGKQRVESPAWDSTAVIVRTSERAFAVLVDEVVGQAQVVIKQLGAEHRQAKGFSGSAILGDGRPSLILELAELSHRRAS